MSSQSQPKTYPMDPPPIPVATDQPIDPSKYLGKPLSGELHKRSWGQVKAEMITGPRAGVGMKYDTPEDLTKRLKDVFNDDDDKWKEKHFLYKPEKKTLVWAAVYTFSKFKEEGTLLGTGYICGKISSFFSEKRPPTFEGTPWTIKDLYTVWAVQFDVDTPQLDAAEQQQFLNRLGDMCHEVNQIDFTVVQIENVPGKYGGHTKKKPLSR